MEEDDTTPESIDVKIKDGKRTTTIRRGRETITLVEYADDDIAAGSVRPGVTSVPRKKPPSIVKNSMR